MEIFVYRKGAAAVEEGFSEEDLPELLAEPDLTIWVDLLGETHDQIDQARRVLLDVFKFHPLTVEDCIETRNQPKIEQFPNYFYFILHGIKPGETSSSKFITKELDGFLGSNFVVTFHLERFLSIKQVKQQLRASPSVAERGAAYLLHQILDLVVDLYMPLVDEFDASISALEEEIFAARRPANQIVSDIMTLRRTVSRLRRISARQLDVLYRMSHGEFPQIPAHILPFYRDIYDHLLRVSDISESYRELVGGLFEIHFAVISTKANDIMKTLAIISSIMLPLTLIAGIYGMNFENMPELRSKYGYFLTLGGMALLTLMQLWYFKRRGWIFTGRREADADNDPERS